MDNNLPAQPKNYQLSKKLIILALLIGVSWVATMFVWGVVQERESRQEGTASLISEQWEPTTTNRWASFDYSRRKNSHYQRR